MRRTIPLCLGLALGLILCVGVGHAEERQLPDHELARTAWPAMTKEQRELVELVARDAADEAWSTLPRARKNALRGEAMRRLGLTWDRARGRVV